MSSLRLDRCIANYVTSLSMERSPLSLGSGLRLLAVAAMAASLLLMVLALVDGGGCKVEFLCLELLISFQNVVLVL